ncbi:MAG TPA: beta-propeller fold lactonase family protein [Terriglobales bacterium]|nr:beta-propeller fold lactonase family protein [Terriglobales bacterium]
MKFRFLVAALGVISLGLTSCSNNSTTTGTSGSGYVWVVAQGNQSVTFYSMNLTTGQLTINSSNPSATTGNLPSAVVVAPSGKAMFVANTNDNTVSAYTINSDGTLTAAGSAIGTGGQSPVSLATDPTGKFLYVANEGDSSISIFSISGATLSSTGNPVSTLDINHPGSTGPSALAITGGVTGSGNFLYVANQLTGTVSGFQYDPSSGSLTQLSPFSVLAGTNPAALVLSPDQNFLYVANSGSSNISSFSTCAVVSSNCASATGLLNKVSGSPFPAGTNPVSLAITPGGEFLYAANKGSNQVSGYKVGSGTGVLTPTATATFSTGLSPIWVAIPPEGKYVYVANSGGSSVTAYGINLTNGFLGEVAGSPYSISNTPTAIAIR